MGEVPSWHEAVASLDTCLFFLSPLPPLLFPFFPFTMCRPPQKHKGASSSSLSETSSFKGGGHQNERAKKEGEGVFARTADTIDAFLRLVATTFLLGVRVVSCPKVFFPFAEFPCVSVRALYPSALIDLLASKPSNAGRD
jgi:hypothetical protein